MLVKVQLLQMPSISFLDMVYCCYISEGTVKFIVSRFDKGQMSLRGLVDDNFFSTKQPVPTDGTLKANHYFHCKYSDQLPYLFQSVPTPTSDHLHRIKQSLFLSYVQTAPSRGAQ